MIINVEEGERSSVKRNGQLQTWTQKVTPTFVSSTFSLLSCSKTAFAEGPDLFPRLFTKTQPQSGSLSISKNK